MSFIKFDKHSFNQILEIKMNQIIYDEAQIKILNTICETNFDNNDQMSPCLMIWLATRSKYFDQTQIENFSNSEFKKNQFFNTKILVKNSNFVDVIRQYETMRPYKLVNKHSECLEIPSNKLCVYISLNTRDQIKALNVLHSQIITNLLNKSIEQIPKKISSALNTVIHKQPNSKKYIDLDIDTKDKSILEQIFENKNYLIEHNEFLIETKSGYHAIYLKSEISNKLAEMHRDFMQSTNFAFQELNIDGKFVQKRYIAIMNDPTIPIPGCFQAGFKVKFVKVESLFETTN